MGKFHEHDADAWPLVSGDDLAMVVSRVSAGLDTHLGP